MFNWPFAKRGATAKAKTLSGDMPPTEINFDEFASNNDYIKVWLPDRLVTVINRLSANYGSSRPDVIKTILFRHVYGIAAFESFSAWKINIHQQEAYKLRTSDQTSSDQVKFSPMRSQSIEFIGKSTENLKVWLPTKLKVDVEQLAATRGLGVSDYARMVLVKDLLGERFYLNWQQYIGIVPQDARNDESAA